MAAAEVEVEDEIARQHIGFVATIPEDYMQARRIATVGLRPHADCGFVAQKYSLYILGVPRHGHTIRIEHDR